MQNLCKTLTQHEYKLTYQNYETMLESEDIITTLNG